MFTITIKGKEYKVRYGMNSFADTDLMDRTKRIMALFTGAEGKTEDETVQMAKDLFVCVRDLFYYGFMKFNPVATPQEVGDLLDDYIDEAPEGEHRSIMDLFGMVSEELLNQGFLGDLMSEDEEELKVVENPKTRKVKK